MDKIRAQFLPWPLTRASHSQTAIRTRPETIASVMSVFRSRTWAAVRPGFALRSAAFVSPMRATEMIRVTVTTAAATYMSLTAVRTGAGAGGRSGSAGWPPDG